MASSKPSLSAALQTEYQSLFDTCQIRPEKLESVQALVELILGAQSRYLIVADQVGIPWYLVAAIHNMEGSLSFKTHLHNGDSLTGRTINVPAGYPKDGNPPFTWEASAIDALTLDGFRKWSDWSVPGMLFKLELYNGWGYRSQHPDVKSPYLWSFSNHYNRGKYTGDGLWEANAVSKQVGAACILRRLAELGKLENVTSYSKDPALANALANAQSGALRYSPDVVSPGGIELQAFLNTFPGIYLRQDGKIGPLTSDAYKAVFGHYLLGDPRTK